MLDASSVFYMDKLVTGPAGVGVVDIRLPIGENIRRLAKALGKPVEEMVVSVLHRPRHDQLIEEIREAGAGTRLMRDGDVAGGINAARHDGLTDICVGVGGSPEGIVTACAIKALGGHIQGRLWPRDDDEKQRGVDAGLNLDGYVYEADELVRGNNTIFVATGVTNGELVAGVRRDAGYVYTESVVLRGASGTLRRISSEHLVSKWL
jgi:fructose-1,6-bisphosphatase II